MVGVIWDWVKGLFKGKGSIQIGKDNQSVTGSSTGSNSPVVSAGRDVHFTMHGDGSEPLKTEKDELLEGMRKNSFREPVSHVLSQVIRLAQIVGNAHVEHWARLELFGYNRDAGMKEGDCVPEYRAVAGQYYDPYDRPWIVPPKLHFVSEYRLRNGAGTLEEWAKKTDMQNIADPEFIDLIQENFKVSVTRFCFSPVAVIEVVNAIRNHAFDKSRELER